MKKIAFTLISASSLVSLSALAQSSVTIYGLVDQSIRYTTNANASNGSKLELVNGAITNSRWSIRATEDLGDGLRTIVQLENGFDPDMGAANQNGSLFGRKSFIGLANKTGSIKLGRQNTEGFNFFADYDPLTIGNYTQNSWPYFLTRIRNSNVVSTDAKFGGLALGASYGFGETAGSTSANQYWGGRSAYSWGNGCNDPAKPAHLKQPK